MIEEFVKHHRSDDKQKMAELALILSHFRGYNECVNAFIEQIQLTSFRGKDPFKDIVPLCKTSWATISSVFPSPSAVMAKFVLNIYHPAAAFYSCRALWTFSYEHGVFLPKLIQQI